MGKSLNKYFCLFAFYIEDNLSKDSFLPNSTNGEEKDVFFWKPRREVIFFICISWKQLENGNVFHALTRPMPKINYLTQQSRVMDKCHAPWMKHSGKSLMYHLATDSQTARQPCPISILHTIYVFPFAWTYSKVLPGWFF